MENLPMPRTHELERHADEIPFAIACFQFGLQRAAPPDWTIKTYAVELEKTLKSLTCVAQADIHVDDLSGDDVIGDQVPTDIGRGEPNFPRIEFGQIDIELLIPSAVQRELAGDFPADMFTERFHVSIRQQYRTPVAIVRPIDPVDRPAPSLAVIVVRRLLERELSRLGDTIFELQLVGPSPMHIDFYVVDQDDDGGPDYDLDKVRKRGYDEYVFRWRRGRFESGEAALEAVLGVLVSEADLYYAVTQEQIREMRAWEALQDLVERTASLHRATGVRGWARRITQSSRLINEAVIALSGFEVNRVMDGAAIRSDYRDTYSADVEPTLVELVQRNLDDGTQYPTGQVADLLRLFETRRLSGLELNVVFFSALAGGVIGAIITAILSGG
jgi:hypothetical protein